MNDHPIVSICCITYNHEQFIHETIKGFLIQKTTFPVEFIIHDDASTDSTASIIREYAAKDNRIIPILRETNLKSTGVPIFPILYKMARGKYIAMCEGDDYWIDPHKLQKQVDFLEVNPDYVICYHDAVVIDGDDQIIMNSLVGDKYKRDLSTEELKKHSTVIPTATVCYRNVISELPPEFFQVPAGDTFLLSILGLYGKAGYLDKIQSGRYRRHSGGVWNSLKPDAMFLQAAKTYYELSQYYDRIGESNPSNYFMVKYLYSTSVACYWQNEKTQARRKMFLAFKRSPFSQEIWRLFLSFEILGTGETRRKFASFKRYLLR